MGSSAPIFVIFLRQFYRVVVPRISPRVIDTSDPTFSHPLDETKIPPKKVEEVNAAQRSIRLSGVDLVDGTPVLDIKPYVPDYDCPRTGGTHGSGGTGGEGDVRVAVSFGSPVGC